MGGLTLFGTTRHVRGSEARSHGTPKGVMAPCQPVCGRSEEAESQAQRFVDLDELDELDRVEAPGEVTEPMLCIYGAGLPHLSSLDITKSAGSSCAR